MKDKNKVEMPDKSTIRAVARKCPDAKEVLKGMFPEAFEEKEIEIICGQIYKHTITGHYYLLTSFAGSEWTLTNLDSKNSYWCYKTSSQQAKRIIEKHFTLCPNATIIVKEEPYDTCNYDYGSTRHI